MRYIGLMGIVLCFVTAHADPAAFHRSKSLNLPALAGWFEPANDGSYVGHAINYILVIRPASISLVPQPTDHTVANSGIVMHFAKANPMVPRGTSKFAVSNYYVGNNRSSWREGIPRFSTISCPALYPGIDLTLSARGQRFEFDLLVHPHTNLRQVSFAFSGVGSVGVDRRGKLSLNTSSGQMVLDQPFAYQQTAFGRRRIAVRYVREPDGSFGFKVGRYDHSRKLMIDPIVEMVTTFVPASAAFSPGEQPIGSADSIGQDSSGNIYVIGQVGNLQMPQVGIPISSPPPGCSGGCRAAFLLKFDPTGTNLLYATYLSNMQFTTPDFVDRFRLLITPLDEVFISGTGIGLPTTPNSYSSVATSNRPWVAKLDANGQLVFGTYVGANGDVLRDLAVDSQNNVYLVGVTSSLSFPLKQATKSTLTGSSNGFIVKLMPDGSDAIFSTYFGGASDSEIDSAAIGNDGLLYLAGSTKADLGLPAGGFQSSFSAQESAFVVKMDPVTQFLIGGTYLSGTLRQRATALAMTGSSVYVGGATSSGDFPQVQATQPTCSALLSPDDGFVAQLSPDLKTLMFSTCFGGTQTETVQTIRVDSGGSIYAGGTTDSCPFNPMLGFCASGFALKWSSAHLFEWGLSFGEVNDLLINNNSQQEWVVGGASPMVTDDTAGGGFMALVSETASAPVLAVSSARVRFPDLQKVGTLASINAAAPIPVYLTNIGDQPIHIAGISIDNPDFPLSSFCSATLAPQSTCLIDVDFLPSVAGIISGTLTISSDGTGFSGKIPVQGQAAQPNLSTDPTSLDFGTQPVGSAVARTLSLINTSGVNVVFQHLDYNSQEFSGTPFLNPMLGGEQMQVVFAPTSAGTKDATLTIYSDAINGPQTVLLHAVATAGSGSFTFQTPQGGSSTQAISAGQTASFTVMVNSSSNAGGSINFSCTGAPPASNCSVSPASLTLSAGSSATITVQVQTTARMSARNQALPFEIAFSASAFFALCVVRKKRSPTFMCSAVICMAVATSFGCGGNKAPNPSTGTPAGTYTLQLQGTEGTVQQAIGLTLAVN